MPGEVIAQGGELLLAGGVEQRLAAGDPAVVAVLIDQALGAAADAVEGLVMADGVADDGIPLGLADPAVQGAIDQVEQLGGFGSVARGAGKQQQCHHAAEDQQADSEDEQEEGHGRHQRRVPSQKYSRGGLLIPRRK